VRIPAARVVYRVAITPQNPIAQQAGTIFFGYAAEGMIAEFSETGNVKVTYAYTPALGSGSHATWQTNPIYKRDTPFVVSPSNPSNADQLHAFHTDHLGTPHALTAIASSNAASIGKITWRANYESFGEAFIDQTILNGTNLSNNTATENNHRFPGQFFDQETGLAQNLFRDYEGKVGRYAQGDPVGLGGGLNTFAYGYANSISHIDPNGLIAIPFPPPYVPPIPFPPPVVIVVGVILVIYLIYDATRCDGCPACPQVPSRIDKVPPSAPHWPCKGDHRRDYVNTGQGPPPDCKCSYKSVVTCL
jgi:RHS repeat-associated protein